MKKSPRPWKGWMTEISRNWSLQTFLAVTPGQVLKSILSYLPTYLLHLLKADRPTIREELHFSLMSRLSGGLSKICARSRKSLTPKRRTIPLQVTCSRNFVTWGEDFGNQARFGYRNSSRRCSFMLCPRNVKIRKSYIRFGPYFIYFRGPKVILMFYVKLKSPTQKFLTCLKM